MVTHQNPQSLPHNLNMTHISAGGSHPGLTSSIISNLTQKFSDIRSCRVLITPDLFELKKFFYGLGRRGGWRTLYPYNGNLVGQIFTSSCTESLEYVKNIFNIDKLKIYYQLNSNYYLDIYNYNRTIHFE
eukprot:UN27771